MLNIEAGVTHFKLTHLLLHRMDLGCKIEKAVTAQAFSHSLAQAVYHRDFRRGPVTTGGRDVFIELDSLQPFLFEVTGKLQEVILASPQVLQRGH